jgi:HPt (histidine-containing phosphotransfer) domain-containing protein
MSLDAASPHRMHQPMNGSQSLTQAIAKIRHGFLDCLDSRIVLIETTWAAFRSGGVDARQSFDVALNEVHRISGIAASLGFLDISQHAAALEQRLNDLGSGIAVDHEVRTIDREVDAFLNTLESLLG